MGRNDLRKIALSILAGATALIASELVERLDLQKPLHDSAALNQLVIEYRPANNSILLVYGTGKLVTQAHPQVGSSELAPTCIGKISQADVKGLVQEIINHRLFDLPLNEYYFMTASDDGDDFWRALKLHSITIDDGHSRASRQFAAGIYQGKNKPSQRISLRLKSYCCVRESQRSATSPATSLRESTFPFAGIKPCHRLLQLDNDAP